MKIKLNVAEFLPEVLGYVDGKPLRDGSLVATVKEVVRQLQSHPNFKKCRAIIDKRQYPEIEFPADDAEVTVNVHLAGSSAAYDMMDVDWGDNPPLGCFMTSGDALYETAYADGFDVLVVCDVDDLRRRLVDERLQEIDPYWNRYDSLKIRAFITTVAHELAHALEFIAHGGGLTPREVDNLHDEDLLDVSVGDVCSGLLIRADLLDPGPDLCDDDGIIDRELVDAEMERRVEAQAIEWMDWVMDRWNPKAYIQLLEDCALSDADVDAAMEGESGDSDGDDSDGRHSTDKN